MHSEAPDFVAPIINPDWKIALIRSVWYPDCTNALTADAKNALLKAGITESNILFIDAPGSFELPLLSKHAIESLGCHGVIAFGIIVQGATHHAALVAEQAAAGIMNVQLQTGVPVTFEVMFVNTLEDAQVRSIGPKGKGSLAAQTLLSCLAKITEMRS